MKVLTSQRLPGPAFDELTDVEYFVGRLPDALHAPRPGVEAVITFRERFTPDAIELLPNLKLVAVYGVGFDGIDIASCHKRGIIVTNTPGVLDAATAELAIALILASRRRIVEADAAVRRGAWIDASRDLLLGEDLDGSSLGIVGLGRIGQRVARLARALGMKVTYFQRTRLDRDLERNMGVDYAPFDRLLSECDVVSLHCPMTEQTIGLIGMRELNLMRDGACIINTARGPLIVESALVEVLESGRICAGLDVFTSEPEVPIAIRTLPNVVLSPHSGTSTTRTRAAMTRLVVDNILAVGAGRAPITPVG